MKKIAYLSLVVLAVSAAVCAAPPEICRVQGGNVRTIWGEGFRQGEVTVRGWNSTYNEAAVKAALSGKTYSGRELLPASPPKDSLQIKLLSVDPRAQVCAIDFGHYYSGESFFDATIGSDVIWVRNNDGWSRPWLVRAPQEWFVYPEKASPGERIRVFGRNINARLIAVKPVSGGSPIFLKNVRGGRQPVYEASASLPDDIKPGKYQVYVHNGTCGEGGWGGPVSLIIRPRKKPVTNVLSVASFGAKGNGVSDDTAAIQSALRRAEKTAPAIVYFAPGRYPISKTLLVRPGVTLKGAGMRGSTICVLPSRPLKWAMPVGAVKLNGWFISRQKETKSSPMIWMESNTGLEDLGFEDGPGVQQVAYCGHDNVHIARCRMYMPNAPFAAVCAEWGSYGFVMKDCEVEAASGGVYLRHGPHEQVYFGGNKVRGTTPGTANNIFIRSLDRSIVENNTASDADRNFVSQVGHASAYHSILLGNSWYNNIPRRHNSGENMYESGASFWHGKVLKATPTTITVAGTPFVDTKAKLATWSTIFDTFVLILDGRGLGQYRKIVAHTPNSFTVDKPWDITPDATTYITIGRSFAETLWVDNTEEHTANWTAWWGNCFGNVIDGQIIRDGEGIYLWAFESDKPAPVAFNDVIGSEIIGRGQIRFIGPLVFGNTVRATEITDFRYRPSFHGSTPWMNVFDPDNRFGIEFTDAKHTMKTLPSTAPLKDWNIIEASNIYNGPGGIFISGDANHTILMHNQINVDKEKVRDESGTTMQNGK